MTKVAVITRTKDRILFLRRALQSVANQTYTNYVHVIVNDGGEPSSVDELIRALPAEQRSKTKVFHREHASGAPDSIFNESIDKVDSEYFAIHDDDDTWHKDFLDKTVQYLEKQSELAAVVVKTDKIVEKVLDSNILQKRKSQWMPDLKQVSLYRQCIDNQLTPISTLFRRTAYKKVGKFDSSLPVIGDWEFGIRLLQEFDVGFIDSVNALANYHHRAAADNSFASHDHLYHMNSILNKHLRNELAEGKLGVGYIMNKLRYEQQASIDLVKKFLPRRLVNLLKRVQS